MSKTVAVELTEEQVQCAINAAHAFNGPCPGGTPCDILDVLYRAHRQFTTDREREAKVEALANATGWITPPSRPQAINQLDRLNAAGWDLVRKDTNATSPEG